MGVVKNLWAPFGPLDYKEYTIIQTPKGPIVFDQPPYPSEEQEGRDQSDAAAAAGASDFA